MHKTWKDAHKTQNNFILKLIVVLVNFLFKYLLDKIKKNLKKWLSTVLLSKIINFKYRSIGSESQHPVIKWRPGGRSINRDQFSYCTASSAERCTCAELLILFEYLLRVLFYTLWLLTVSHTTSSINI